MLLHNKECRGMPPALGGPGLNDQPRIGWVFCLHPDKYKIIHGIQFVKEMTKIITKTHLVMILTMKCYYENDYFCNKTFTPVEKRLPGGGRLVLRANYADYDWKERK